MIALYRHLKICLHFMKKIALLGEYNPGFTPHLATNLAIKHASNALEITVESEWVPTGEIDESLFHQFAGIWVAPGSPYKNMAKTLWAIRYARENAIPCFGTCGGFQHMILEYARNELGFADAQHAEYDPYASTLFISRLPCSLAGREMTLTLIPNSRVAEIYGTLSVQESYYCNFGVNPEKVTLLKGGALQVTGSDQEGEVRVIELSRHPFFIGTLFVPQVRSREDLPHPLVSAFVKSVLSE